MDRTSDQSLHCLPVVVQQFYPYEKVQFRTSMVRHKDVRIFSVNTVMLLANSVDPGQTTQTWVYTVWHSAGSI